MSDNINCNMLHKVLSSLRLIGNLVNHRGWTYLGGALIKSLVIPLSKEVKPKKGEKMVKVVLYFWTDELAEKKAHIKPKVCWDYGVVTLPANSSHGITASQDHFSRPSKILLTIEKLFKKQGITMVHGNRSETSGELYTSM